MPVVMSTQAVEESTYVVTAAFTDENGDAVIPNVINWTLTDIKGNIINCRDSVSVASPAASITIILQGEDLGIDESYEEGAVRRILTLEATYDSNLGSNLPLKDSMTFTVVNLKSVI